MARKLTLWIALVLLCLALATEIGARVALSQANSDTGWTFYTPYGSNESDARRSALALATQLYDLRLFAWIACGIALGIHLVVLNRVVARREPGTTAG
jgi:heme/copper-type cytochrome/quinol oxidase subunit 1